jgi:hypothetical protein
VARYAPPDGLTNVFAVFDTDYYVRFLSGFFNRTPGPPPFSSMNSTPADSKARRTAKSFAMVMEREREKKDEGSSKGDLFWSNEAIGSGGARSLAQRRVAARLGVHDHPIDLSA